ncbi:MAG: pyridine nucleotide-disulfide oxidoreductase family protein [Herminiimonas sp.]|nr:pyridine nucleotide-disulfide oxidoreductase family protein [Herminiimonas sp.]
MQHLIIGNGPAGVIAAETIRKQKPLDRIMLLGDEPEPPYSRMAIPYLLHGKIDEAGTHLRKKPGHFIDLRIEQVMGRATRIHTERKEVELADGSNLAWDRLLLATGSTPARPPLPGMELPNVINCWTMADARRIMTATPRGTRVLQMGAGFIGCIILEALAMRGVQLTVVEMGDRMVPRMMGDGAAGMIRRWCEEKGVAVRTGARVESISPLEGSIGGGIGSNAPGGLRVALSDGTHIDVDVVICATGVKPTVGFAKESGIACATGILVDSTMQTSVQGIYAAGDCAEAFDLATGKTVVSAIQPNAAEQARCAGLNMAGHPARLHDVTLINVLDTLGLVSSSFGQWEGAPGGEHAELADPAAFRYVRLEFNGDLLIGANTIGLTQHIGVLRGLIAAKVPLGEWKAQLMANPLALSEAYIASTQKQNEWLAGRASGK